MLISYSVQKQSAEEKEQPALSLLSLFTFSPVGNPLESLTPVQRQFFFNSMMRLMQLQSAENEQRVRALAPKLLQPALGMGMLSAKSRAKAEEKKARQELEAAPESAQAHLERIRMERLRAADDMAQEKRIRAERLRSAQELSSEKARARILAQGGVPKTIMASGAAGAKYVAGAKGGILQRTEPLEPLASRAEEMVELQKSEMLQRLVFKQFAQEIRKVQQGLAIILNDYARGDAHKAEEILSEFSRRVESERYKADELGAVLLLVIEDAIWAGEEGELGSARPGGSANRMRAAIPEKIRQTAAESAEIRLASVREMLRYYFMRHPDDYRGALALALSLSEEDAADDEFVRAKLTGAIAELGAFAVAQKVLSAIKQKRKMDTKKCLLELGYKYDVKNRKLVVGKRTCGKPAEARGIIAVLLSKYKKPKDN